MACDGGPRRVDGVKRGQDVLRGSAIRVAERFKRTPVLADRFTAWIDCLQYLVGIGDRLTNGRSLTTQALPQRAQYAVEFGRVDLVEHPYEVLEDGVYLGADGDRRHKSAGRKMLRPGILRGNQIHKLRAERGGSHDLRLNVGWNVWRLVRIDFDFEVDRFSAGDTA